MKCSVRLENLIGAEEAALGARGRVGNHHCVPNSKVHLSHGPSASAAMERRTFSTLHVSAHLENLIKAEEVALGARRRANSESGERLPQAWMPQCPVRPLYRHHPLPE